MRYTSVVFAFLFMGQFGSAQDLPFPRRLLILTQRFLDSAELREMPAAVPNDQSRVLVLFRLGEQGSVIDTRAIGGSERAKAAAIAAVKIWRFKPTLVGGQPAQMQSGAVFDFSLTPVKLQTPAPMSGEQISPVLSNRCYLAMSKGDSDVVAICRKEVRSVDMNRSHTAMESLSAHDELGIALLKFAKEPQEAVKEFDQAIELATKGLTTAHGETGQLYWHRAEARRQLNQAAQAAADFALAAESFESAARTVDGETALWYRASFAKVVRQHASLLESTGHKEEAESLLKKLGQQ
jgi:TonB family protein